MCKNMKSRVGSLHSVLTYEQRNLDVLERTPWATRKERTIIYPGKRRQVQRQNGGMSTHWQLTLRIWVENPEYCIETVCLDPDSRGSALRSSVTWFASPSVLICMLHRLASCSKSGANDLELMDSSSWWWVGVWWSVGKGEQRAHMHGLHLNTARTPLVCKTIASDQSNWRESNPPFKNLQNESEQ